MINKNYLLYQNVIKENLIFDKKINYIKDYLNLNEKEIDKLRCTIILSAINSCYSIDDILKEIIFFSKEGFNKTYIYNYLKSIMGKGGQI